MFYDKLAQLKRILFCYLVFSATVLAAFAQHNRPNVLVIISDDHAYQSISAYGSKIAKTPGIDKLASEGAVFTNAYVTNSICGPSRAAFLSGKYSNKNGFKDNENSNFNFNQDIFVKRLRDAGYQTAWIGKMHLGDSIPQGFDYYNILPGQGHYYNPDFIETGNKRHRYKGYVTNLITDMAEDWLNKRDTGKPFCLIIGHKATHRNWLPDLEDLGKYDSIRFPVPASFYDDYNQRYAAQVQDMTIAKTLRQGYDLKMFDNAADIEKEGTLKRLDSQQRQVFFGYYNKVRDELNQMHLSGNQLAEWKFQRYLKDYLSTAASLDRNIARIMNYVEANKLGKNTIVIYLSDQGFYLGEHGWFDKRFMYQESFRTPMVIRYPGVVKPATVLKGNVLNIDIAPTLLQACGVEVPLQMQGKSFLPLLQGNAADGRKELYYHYYENGEHAVSPHFGIKAGRYKLIRFYKRVESWELFDLATDPSETKNIIYTPKGKKLFRSMKAQLLKQIELYEDAEARAICLQPLNGY